MPLIADAQVTQLATWDAAPTLTPGSGKDFDPQLDATISCSGCWTGRNLGSGISYSQSTTNGVTQGTGALQAIITGKGAGGEYNPTINGSTAVQLDTHFDYPLVVTYTNLAAANNGVVDSRFTAIDNAVKGVDPLATYELQFDIVYDVQQMRSIPWQPPQETVDPVNNGAFPQRFMWVGMWGNANGAAPPFTFTGFDIYDINAFDPVYDATPFVTVPATFPLDDFNFNPDPANTTVTEYRFGILYNSVFGTLPAAQNTTGLRVYFDNFRLVGTSILADCDMNSNGSCNFQDYQLFMGEHLKTNPIFGDLVGNFGAAGMNGVNDIYDLLEFENAYDTVNGAGSLANAISGVPEPSSLALVALSMLGLLATRARRFIRPVMPIAALAVVGVGLAQQSAQAQIGVEQLLEGFETPGRFVANPGAAQGANPIVAYQSAKGVTQGTMALKVTQNVVLTGDGFSWNANTNPNYAGTDSAFTMLANAVNIGAEHFNVLADVRFDPADLPAISAATVTLGLNFNGQTIGTYAGEPEAFTTTATIPLSAFNLSDVEDQGAGNYSAQIGITATGDVDAFSVYVDNLRLVQVTAPDLLTLEINRPDGVGILKNLTANPISWDYMTIKSPLGGLDLTNWSSLDDQSLDSNLWVEAGGSSAFNLTEGHNTGSHTLAPGATINLGSLYNQAMNTNDIDLEIRRPGQAEPVRTYDQLVTYTGPDGLMGDFNGDGKVGAEDYTVWRNNQGLAEGNLLNGNGNGGTIDATDYALWKTHFGEMSMPGSGSGVAGVAVPEPATMSLWIGALLASSVFIRRRS